MALTYQLIASSVASVDVSDFTFTSIPQTYTDLVMRVTARNNSGSIYQYFAPRFNNATTGHTNAGLIFLGSSSVVDLWNNTTSGAFVYGFVGANNVTSGYFSTVEMYIPSYTLGGSNHPVWITTAVNGTTNAGSAVGMSAGNFAGNAITQIAIGGTFLAGSSAFLYGIKNS